MHILLLSITLLLYKLAYCIYQERFIFYDWAEYLSKASHSFNQIEH